MEIIECPKCGRPRALGHRCPSCGDAATEIGEQAAAQTESWGPAAAPPEGARPATAQPATKQRRKISWTLLAAVVVGLAIIAAAIAVPLSRDAGTPEKKESGRFAAALEAQVAELTGEPVVRTGADVAEEIAGRNDDMMARILVENAMETMDGIIARLDESGEYPTTEYNTLIREALRSAPSHAIHWEWGARGVCEQPHGSSQASENTVSWTFLPPSTYELGTWSGSGSAFGVRVDNDEGTIIFYRDGTVGH